MSNLNEFTKSEWWDVYRSFNPTATEAEFDVVWEDAMEAKKLHLVKKSVQ